ncbi:hypothetical protein ACWT_8087 [Actinoplanes sp. SE50]|uniref:hypothetical protein n=1 Tax=unclassified Actinoplanes TaxID=2626549 RepID=UPI00023EDCF6|nr:MULTISPECIES: hypothetical protein [unclassified Actinoplanes]AEV89096.1 hypothetical protein ACPL_8218 [Actinoplanes sp. SE50/110]ATO87502.1 hypothetical protein ACWT_8087 [Actinoplanes sp. SE50]SLM04920.1 hypothetical protein ACSP50_8232 [Actinoplanes sp. SE50/110]
MKRTLAVALMLGALITGGCDRGAPRATNPPAPAATQADDGVDSLLDDAGTQLSHDDQPAEDED